MTPEWIRKLAKEQKNAEAVEERHQQENARVLAEVPLIWHRLTEEISKTVEVAQRNLVLSQQLQLIKEQDFITVKTEVFPNYKLHIEVNRKAPLVSFSHSTQKSLHVEAEESLGQFIFGIDRAKRVMLLDEEERSLTIAKVAQALLEPLIKKLVLIS